MCSLAVCFGRSAMMFCAETEAGSPYSERAHSMLRESSYSVGGSCCGAYSLSLSNISSARSLSMRYEQSLAISNFSY